MSANIVKIWLDPKKSTYAESTYNLNTRIVETRAMEYYTIQWDNKVSDPTVCFSATDGTTSIPVVGDSYAANPNSGLRVTRVYPQKSTESPFLWSAQVEYSTLVPDFSGNQTQDKWDIQVNIGTEIATETIGRDLTDKPIHNTAGEDFEQQPTFDYYIQVITISYKTYKVDVAAIESLIGKMNSQPITININGYIKQCEALSLRLAPPRFSTVVGANTTPAAPIWQVELELRYLPPKANPNDNTKTVSGWELFMLDQGYNYFDPTKGKTQFTESSGNPVNKPQYLDGQTGNKSNTAHWLDFALIASGDFTPIIASTAGIP